MAARVYLPKSSKLVFEKKKKDALKPSSKDK